MYSFPFHKGMSRPTRQNAICGGGGCFVAMSGGITCLVEFNRLSDLNLPKITIDFLGNVSGSEGLLRKCLFI